MRAIRFHSVKNYAIRAFTATTLKWSSIETPQVGPEESLTGPPARAPARKASLHPLPIIPSDPLADRSGRPEPPQPLPQPISTESVPETQKMARGKFRRVGNVLVVRVIEYPFKFDWEINSVLRFLRLEFKDQTMILPDEPKYRAAIFRVRHLVSVEMINTDELKKLLGIPDHVTFRDLAKTLPEDMNGERPPSVEFVGFEDSLADFTILRKRRLKDVLARDAVELRLLNERKKLAAKEQSSKTE
jgi:ribosomal protein L30/L7E